MSICKTVHVQCTMYVSLSVNTDSQKSPKKGSFTYLGQVHVGFPTRQVSFHSTCPMGKDPVKSSASFKSKQSKLRLAQIDKKVRDQHLFCSHVDRECWLIKQVKHLNLLRWFYFEFWTVQKNATCLKGKLEFKIIFKPYIWPTVKLHDCFVKKQNERPTIELIIQITNELIMLE